MKRIAIVGAGIAGVAAAYELAQLQRSGVAVEFVLFESTARLGGIVETERRDGFVVECGPDSWVTEKPWARELAVELGLGDEILTSNDQWRRTYLAEDRKLAPMPDGMRMMVPTNWAAILNSPLFGWQAKLAYLREPKMAEQLKANALDAQTPPHDESVRDFTCRHFGAEVADTLAAPLLAGVFGGDIATLSVRAVMPAFVALEREHGSLILGLQERLRQKTSRDAVFTTLRHGLGGLIDGMEARIPVTSIRRNRPVLALERSPEGWHMRTGHSEFAPNDLFDAVLIATPTHATATLLTPLDARIPELLPQQASSAIVVALAFAPEQAHSLRIPRGFGFLVPQRKPAPSESAHDTPAIRARHALLACTFVDQKFPHRTPPGAVLLRGFFGGADAPSLLEESNATLAHLAAESLGRILGKLPDPSFTVVRRWPRSLPLYAVGHLERMAELDDRISLLPGLQLIGNAYNGVGLPDLVRSGRAAAKIAADQP
ncbi:MAG TPA: protoporphyrinogen oxidase [Acidobacteriaceae bacterium]|jgi:oxygen-dependent protoporphyrinogen oxidase|nr:protoporphyrinogen oxidase [Acidobacteriaceae bacterium]